MVFIIIPVFKRLNHTLAFLRSCEYHISNKCQFIIVDDSPDFEHWYHFQNDPSKTVLKGNGNLWWGGSVNIGIEYIHSNVQPKEEDVICIANNDIEILESTWTPIRDFLNQRADVMVSPRVLNKNGHEIHSGANLISWIPIRARYALSFTDEVEEVNLVTGRFLCMNYSTFKRVGKVSENLPHYGGDWDFSLKAERQGVKSFMLRDSLCIVDETTTGNRYENGMGLKEIYNALFTDIKSPQNLNFKYHFIRNHNSWIKSQIAILAEFVKTIIKYTIGRVKGN